MTKGILINLDKYNGDKAVEDACKEQFNLAELEYGIQVGEIGPWTFQTGELEGVEEHTFAPVPTKSFARLYAAELNGDATPACLEKCDSDAVFYGEISELAKMMDGSARWVLNSIRTPESKLFCTFGD